MAALTETEQWEQEIYQLETTDPVEGGPNGVDNRQAKELANRTKWLKGKIDERTEPATETTAGIVKQSSQSDAISGTKVTGGMAPKRVHEAFGQFGLGSTAKLQNGINIDTQLTKTLFLNASSASCTGTLPPGAAAGTLQHIQRTVDSAAQVWIENSGGSIFVRAFNVTAWSDWKPLWAGDASHLFASNGYQKLPSGLIMQWGTIGHASPGTIVVNFPVVFPNGVLVIAPNKIGIAEEIWSHHVVNGTESQSGFSHYSNMARNATYFAFGY